jgi:thioredoxin reductase (NADPH)
MKKTENDVHELLIIGSGPAGLTAAIYAARAEMKPIILGGKTPGGQLMTTSDVENFPGFPDGIMGPDLMSNMMKQAKRFGSELLYENATEVDFSSSPLIVKTEQNTYQAKSVIVATGADAKWLGLDSEERLKGKGVSSCATCDGAFFRDKKLYVVGAGDSAMEEADFLTKFASSVTVLVRKGQEDMRASKIMQQRVMDNEKIDMQFHTSVLEVLGETTVTGLKLVNNDTKEESEVQADGLFVAIGHKPNTEIFKGVLSMNQVGYLERINPRNTTTEVDGVFMAGDVHDNQYRQGITAAGFGCMAALDAEKYLAKNK